VIEILETQGVCGSQSLHKPSFGGITLSISVKEIRGVDSSKEQRFKTLWTPIKPSKSEERVSPKEERSQLFNPSTRESEPSIRRDTWRATNVSQTHAWEKSKGRAPRIHEMRNCDVIRAIGLRKDLGHWLYRMKYRHFGDWKIGGDKSFEFVKREVSKSS